MRIRGQDWAIVACFVTVFHIVGTALVRYYYGYHIAHYDSVGGLIQGVQTLQAYHDHGYLAGLASGWEKAPLSITQNMFAALLAPYLDPDPQGLQLYNTLAFAVAATSMMVLLRRFGAGIPAIMLGMAALLLGDALYWWDLGVFDFRRDFAMYCLISSMLMLGGAYLAGPQKLSGEIRLGLAFGVITGLTLICRDSAPLLMMGVAIVPLAVFWAYGGLRDGWMPQLRKAIWPLVGFVPFAIVFFLKLSQLLDRVANPLVMFGIDADGPNTLISNARRIPDALLGLFAYPFNNTPWISSALVLLMIAGLGYLCFRSWRGSRAAAPADAPALETAAPETPVATDDEAAAARARTRILWFLLGAAIWVPTFLHIFFAGILKWAADQPPIVAMAPYLLTLAGVSLAIAAGIIFSSRQFSTRTGKAIAFALVAAIALAAPARALSRLIGYPPGTYEAHVDLARLSSNTGGPAVVATLTDRSELMRTPAIQLMALQRGLPMLQQLRVQTHEGESLDFQIGIPDDLTLRASILDAMDKALRCNADYIVASREPGFYAREGDRLLIYAHGAEMIGEIVADLSDHVVRALDAENTTVLMDNRQRTTCPAAQ